MDIRRQFFYREFDALTSGIIAYQNRVQNDGGTFINQCLRTRLNTELPLSDRLSILTPNGRKVGKLYSFKGTDYDFARASNAYRFNSVGDLEVVANDVPRINFFANECPQIVIEPQLTNITTNNQGTYGFANTTEIALPSHYSGFAFRQITFAGGFDYRLSGANIGAFNLNFNISYSIIIENPITNTFVVRNTTASGEQPDLGFYFSSLEVANTRPDVQQGFIRKIKDNMFLLSFTNTTGSMNVQNIRGGFTNGSPLTVAGTCNFGLRTLCQFSLSEQPPLGIIPIPTSGIAVTKLADVATVTPEIGTNEIIVNGGAPITTIPTTFQIPNGFINKIVMK